MDNIIEVDTVRKITGGSPDLSNVTSAVIGVNTLGKKMGLDRAHRLAHYFAQLAHESGRFRHDREIWGPTAAQLRYEGRADLGNTQPGDGFRFRGRTGIQLTGRHNYREFTKWCRKHIDPKAPDFEANPDLVNTDPWEGLAPICYWDAINPDKQSLNRFADTNNIEAVTRKINGGLNGFQDRTLLYTRSALVFMGYPMVKGVVLRFQKDVGFTGADLDDIAGQKTRDAMHKVLLSMPPLGQEKEEEEEPPVVVDEPVVDLTTDLERARALIGEADEVLAQLLRSK